MISFFKNIFKPSADISQLVRAGAIIIDVRSQGEYQAGHIIGSKNIPLDKLSKETSKIKQFNKPIITVCHSGARSRMAKSMLSTAGIEVYNGGGWLSLKNKLQ